MSHIPRTAAPRLWQIWAFQGTATLLRISADNPEAAERLFTPSLPRTLVSYFDEIQTPSTKATLMICQCCGIEAPTKKTAFYQNIGALVMRFSKSIEGNLCKSCIHKNFWSMSGTTLVLGWWGMISLILTPLFLLNNIVRYLIALPMDPVPEGAKIPELTDRDREKIAPHLQGIVNDLNDADSQFQEIAQRYSDRIGVTPGQIALAIHELARASPE